MDAKLSNFSELSNILSVKSSLRTNLMALFTRFGLGHLLCRMSLEKQAGVPAVQLILSLCLFRIAGESIHSMYKKSYYDLLNTGHNCYYRMLRRATSKRVRDASIYASKKISLKFLFLSDIFLFPPIRQQVPILA